MYLSRIQRKVNRIIESEDIYDSSFGQFRVNVLASEIVLIYFVSELAVAASL